MEEQTLTDTRDLEELTARSSGRPAPRDVARLYHQAFRDFGAQALWNRARKRGTHHRAGSCRCRKSAPRG
jgi:hypothetical protein